MNNIEKASEGFATAVQALMNEGFTGEHIVRTLVYVAGASTFCWTEGREGKRVDVRVLSSLVSEAFSSGYRAGPEGLPFFPEKVTPWNEEGIEEESVSNYSIQKTGV